MLHVRVVSPASTTGLLLARLAALPGIQNLNVLEGPHAGQTAMPSFFDVAGVPAGSPVRGLPQHRRHHPLGDQLPGRAAPQMQPDVFPSS